MLVEEKKNMLPESIFIIIQIAEFPSEHSVMKIYGLAKKNFLYCNVFSEIDIKETTIFNFVLIHNKHAANVLAA